jgi:hypothetical protein
VSVRDEARALDAWRSIPSLVQRRIQGCSERTLDHRPEGAAMSLRETVHHVAEANAVAASIVIAALGSPGCVYDWSWMLPFGKWMENLAYAEKPIAPALRFLEALNEYVAAQVEPLGDGLQRSVRLRDQPGAEPRSATVAEVLLQEYEHARGHLEGAR